MRTLLAVLLLALLAVPAQASHKVFCRPCYKPCYPVYLPDYYPPPVITVENKVVQKTFVENNFIQPAPTPNTDPLTDDLTQALIAKLQKPKGNLPRFTFASNTPPHIPQRVQQPQAAMVVPQAQGFFYQNVITTGSVQNQVTVTNNTSGLITGHPPK